mgnify:CR=1 FL=1
MRIFVAEWMKTRHTILHRLVLLIPLFCSLAVLGYAAYRKNSFSLAFFYQGFFLIWSAVLLPLGVGILTGILVHEEEEAGNFYGLLQCSRKRSSLYLGKIFSSIGFLDRQYLFDYTDNQYRAVFSFAEGKGSGAVFDGCLFGRMWSAPRFSSSFVDKFRIWHGSFCGSWDLRLTAGSSSGEHIFGRPYLVCGSVDLSGENGDVSYGLFYVSGEYAHRSRKTLCTGLCIESRA